MTTKQLLSSNSYIQYPKFLGSHIGSNEALLLSVFCDVDSWCNFNIEDYDGWFYILQNDILWETGLSEKQQRAALSHLYELNIIYIEKRDVPAKNYYFINTDELENVLNDAYINYKAHKTQMLQNVTSRTDKMSHQDTTKNSVSSIKTKNKNIKINNKGTGAGASSKNHSQVYKQKQTLSDDLESGKDIAEQKKAEKKSPKDKFREECLDIIDDEYSEKNYSYTVKDLLVEYFEFVSAVPENKDNLCKRVKTTKAWKHKLVRLDELVKDGYDPIDIIQQSLDKKQYVFYPLQSAQKVSKGKETLSDRLVGTDLEDAKRRYQEAIDNGEEFF